jgi:hypothetical protein
VQLFGVVRANERAGGEEPGAATREERELFAAALGVSRFVENHAACTGHLVAADDECIGVVLGHGPGFGERQPQRALRGGLPVNEVFGDLRREDLEG